MLANRAEARSAKEQVKSGLRLGIGFASFFVGGMLLGAGLNNLVWQAAPPHWIVWSDLVGWSELLAGIAILSASAGVWWQLFAGYVLIGTLKSFLVLMTGTELYAPHEPFSRAVAAVFVCYGVATIALMARFTKHPLMAADRLALTLFLVFFMWRADAAEFSALAPGLIAGPLLLLLTRWANDALEKRRG